MTTQLSPAALRTARQERLAAATAPKPEAKTAAPVKPEATVVAPVVDTKALATSVPREMTAKVADPGLIDATAKISLTGPYNSDSDNPHWVVLANGEPLAKIALKDQDDAAKLAKIFPHEDFAKSFIAASKKLPLAKLLEGTKARPYIAVVKSTEVFAALDSKYQADSKTAFQKKAAQYRDELLTMASLVVEAQRKNYITGNPLKDSLFKHLKSAGLNNPVPVIEAAFIEGGTVYFEEVLKQAMKWMDLHPEALADIKQNIQGTPVRTVSAAVGSSNARQEPKPPVPGAHGNVPIVATGGNSEKTDAPTEKSAVAATFSFRTRMQNRGMAENG